jgi:hypothetical protein
MLPVFMSPVAESQYVGSDAPLLRKPNRLSCEAVFFFYILIIASNLFKHSFTSCEYRKSSESEVLPAQLFIVFDNKYKILQYLY